MLSEDRWTEIKFMYLCLDLYASLKDYVFTTEYLEFASNLAKVDKAKTLRLLQKNVTFEQRPTQREFITVARQNNCTVESICRALGISKEYYKKIFKECDLSIAIPARNDKETIRHMDAVLKANERIKKLGV